MSPLDAPEAGSGDDFVGTELRFADVVATSAAVAAASGRNAKRDTIASLLTRLGPEEVEPAIGFLVGEPRQGRIGVGWATLSKLEQIHADVATITIAEVDEALSGLADANGPGSVSARHGILSSLFTRATSAEATFLVRLLGGELRHGAMAGVVADAVARASAIPAASVRRATMLGGRLDLTARLALTEGRAAVDAVTLQVGRGIQPMLASTAATPTEAVQASGRAAIEWKLDGIRIQVHRDGDHVRVFSRNLNDITDRVPGVVAVARGLPASRLVLDGEAMALGDGGRPLLFQDSVSTVSETALRPFFFDVLHLDGADLIDEPLSARRELLTDLAPGWQVPGIVTDDPTEAEALLTQALTAGHEGVVVKAVDSAYEAGRRGKSWRKVKPVHTLDLVVVAVEWGHGRRAGWLSNLHLGAVDPEGTIEAAWPGAEGLVMVGKTFKGLTDELLRWQTERFTGLAAREERWQEKAQTGTVWVRPEQVVEIAVDGVQRSTRYPGGVALRFARVVRYRPDKDPSQADTISTVRALMAS